MSIEKHPRILVLHLKRFSFGSSYGKINKPVCSALDLYLPFASLLKMFFIQVKFDECIEITSGSSEEKVKYHLYGVIVHHGNSTHSGHYVAFVKVRLKAFILLSGDKF